MPKIVIRADEMKFLEDFLEKNNISSGETYVIPETNATIEYIGYPRRRTVIPPETFNFMLNLGTGAASGIIANWLYDKLIGKAKLLMIENTEISIEKDIIKIEIEKHMRKI